MNTDTEKSVPRKKGAAKKKGTARKKGVAKKKGADTDVNKRYFWIIITLIYLVLFALEVIVLSKYEVLVLDTKVNLGLSVFLAQVLYTFASLRIIGPKELGAR
ncbi:hypothetical protein IIB50_00095, partial [Patescibacteria group bacterium]|nr:hypothetical protein [Patescibacteria group bacterium]